MKFKKPDYSKIKKYVKQHKLLFIILLVLSVGFLIWEGYSVFSYKELIQQATRSQQQRKFDNAEEDLLRAKELTERSLLLLTLRRDDIIYMLSVNEGLQQSYEEFLISLELKEETEEVAKEVEDEDLEPDDSQDDYVPIVNPSPSPPVESTPKPIPEPVEEEETPVDTRVDTAAPVVNDILLSKQTVTRGDSITVTVDVTDDISGVKYVSVRLESPTGIHYSSYSIWSIDSQGRWYDPMVIPLNSETGTWTVKTIGVHDEVGNGRYYEYGVDIFKTFEVI